MTDDDRMARMKWAQQELERAYPDPESPVRQMVTALLSMWARVHTYTRGTEQTRVQQEAVEVFALLTYGRPLNDSGDPEPARVWGDAVRYHGVSEIARVRQNYDTSVDGWKFNGREGTIVGIRHGDVIVEFTTPLEGAPSNGRFRLTDLESDITHLSSSA